MIKGVLFDIDETLYSKLKYVPPKTIELLQRLKAKGIKLGFCTARTVLEMQDLPKELVNLFECKILVTGAITLAGKNFRKCFVIDKEITNKYIAYFKDHNLSYCYTVNNGNLYYWGDEELITSGKILTNAKGRVVLKEYEETDEVVNLFYFNANRQEVNEIEDLNPNDTISTWDDKGSIVYENIDKGSGVDMFCKVYNLKPEEVVACGDGTGDDLMFKKAGIGIAMYIAKDKVKKAADYICDKPIEEDGLYDMFKKLNII